jgi:hypothetical protein
LELPNPSNPQIGDFDLVNLDRCNQPTLLRPFPEGFANLMDGDGFFDRISGAEFRVRCRNLLTVDHDQINREISRPTIDRQIAQPRAQRIHDIGLTIDQKRLFQPAQPDPDLDVPSRSSNSSDWFLRSYLLQTSWFFLRPELLLGRTVKLGDVFRCDVAGNTWLRIQCGQSDLLVIALNSFIWLFLVVLSPFFAYS